jgi:hypothetical protein
MRGRANASGDLDELLERRLGATQLSSVASLGEPKTLTSLHGIHTSFKVTHTILHGTQTILHSTQTIENGLLTREKRLSPWRCPDRPVGALRVL